MISNDYSNLNTSLVQPHQKRLKAFSNHLTKVSEQGLASLNRMNQMIVDLRNLDRRIEENLIRLRPLRHFIVITFALTFLTAANVGWYYANTALGVRIGFGFLFNFFAIVFTVVFDACFKNFTCNENERLLHERENLSRRINYLAHYLDSNYSESSKVFILYSNWRTIKKSQFDYFKNSLFLQVVSELFIRHRYND